MSRQLLLVAASGLARETAEAALAAGDEVVGYLDDDQATWDSTCGRARVLGGLPMVEQHPDAMLTICAGKGASRRRLAHRLLCAGVTAERFATVVHPSVHVPDSAVVGAGSILLAGTVLTADVSIGSHVVCMPHVTLTHDNRIDDFATLCAGVALGGGVRVGAAAYVGMGASVRERVWIGPDSTLGMGSLLLQSIPPGQTWFGQPATRRQSRPPAQEEEAE